MTYRYCLLFAGLLPVWLAQPIAAAASFDCGRAASRFEVTVCADSGLSAQDVVMAQRYGAALRSLSAPGKTMLRAGQRMWLKTIGRLCFAHNGDEDSTVCLRRHYAARIDDLRRAAVAIGPFVFSRNDYYASTGARTLAGQTVYRHISLPRIDQPISPQTEQWNAAMTRWAAQDQANWCFGDSDAPAHQSVGFKVHSATSVFINVAMSHYQQCGAAAGAQEVSNITYLFKPSLHRLEAGEMFRPDSGWEAFLTERALRALGAEGAIVFADGVGKGVRDPSAWSFTGPGLLISFNPGQAGAAASGILEVTIPWTDLQRFLVPDAPRPS